MKLMVFLLAFFERTNLQAKGNKPKDRLHLLPAENLEPIRKPSHSSSTGLPCVLFSRTPRSTVPRFRWFSDRLLFTCLPLCLSSLSLLFGSPAFAEEALQDFSLYGVEGSKAEKNSLFNEPRTESLQTVSTQRFESYESAQTVLIDRIQKAATRVIVITGRLSDAAIATALHSVSIRRKDVQVLIDARSIQLYNSRHHYLLNANIPVYSGDFRKMKFESPTLLITDNDVLRVSVALDSTWSREVNISDSKFTADEIIAEATRPDKSNRPGRLKKLTLVPAPQAERQKLLPKQEATSAKTPTNRLSYEKRKEPKSGSMLLRARAPMQRNSEIPKTLPRRTRFEEIRAGFQSSDDRVKPVRSLQDGVLELHNEAELLKD